MSEIWYTSSARSWAPLSFSCQMAVGELAVYLPPLPSSSFSKQLWRRFQATTWCRSCRSHHCPIRSRISASSFTCNQDLVAVDHSRSSSVFHYLVSIRWTLGIPLLSLLIASNLEQLLHLFLMNRATTPLLAKLCYNVIQIYENSPMYIHQTQEK